MLYVYTGDGKGKTTAALGLIMRAYGAGKSCAIVFFDKNSEFCNELTTLKELGIQSYIFGMDRIYPVKPPPCGVPNGQFNGVNEGNFRLTNTEEDFREASKAINMAYTLAKNEIDILVLDEFLNAIRLSLLPLGEALGFIDSWPVDKYLVVTGRGLPEEIKIRADLISEVQAVKHPLDAGVAAQKGIDY